MAIFGTSAGAMLVPLIIGQLFPTSGPSVLMMVITVTMLMALVVLAAVIYESRISASPISHKNGGCS